MQLSHRTTWSLLAMMLIAALVLPAFAARRPAERKSAEPARDAAAPPQDAQWTLYCQAIAGPAHVEQAKAVKDQLLTATEAKGLKDWYVIHQEGQSVLYHGFYRTISEDDAKDRREGERAQRDRKTISGLRDQQGNRIFEHVYFVQVAAPDPVAPPEWNLVNAEGFFTLQIAAYKDSPQRKQAAVDAVREARAQGVEAYYYHGETTSSVCIGAWPRSAVREQEESHAQTANQDQDILLLPMPLPNQEKLEVLNAEGERVKTFAPRFEPIDPSLIAALEKYPTHAVNGIVYVSKAQDPITGEMKQVEDPSYIVEIPKAQTSLLRQTTQAPQLLAPTTPSHSTQGGGKLRSLGD